MPPGSLSSLAGQGRLCHSTPWASQLTDGPALHHSLQKPVRSPWASGSGGAVLCSFPFCVLEPSPPHPPPQGGTPLHFLWDYRPCLWLSWNLVLFETVKPGPCGVSQPQWAVLPFMAASPCSTRSPVTASKNNSACSFHYKLN